MDNDRSLTIQAFAELAKNPTVEAFGKSFRAPGHVHLCVGAEKLLHQRKGHTEIGVALARLAGVTPVLAGAEMLADDGRARRKVDAQAWASANGTVLLHGREIEEAWLKLETQVPASR